MNSLKILLYTLLITFYSLPLFAQVVFVPVENNVYSFLDRMNIKGVIQLDSEVKPYSRKYIAEKLIKIDNQVFTLKKILTKIDRELLEFYIAEYGSEVSRILRNYPLSLKTKSSTDFAVLKNNFSTHTLLSKDYWGRIRLLSYDDSLFSFKFAPIAAYSFSNTGGKSGHKQTGGLRVDITASDWFGGSLEIRDNGEFGENVDTTKYLTPTRGADFVHAPNGIEHSDIRAQINFNWNWGTISLKKDYGKWGNGSFGNVILSDKSPSYPHVYLELKPVKWFRFYYQFGWLHSGVIDSAKTIVVNDNDEFYLAHERFVKKYLTINMMTVAPWDIFDFSLGNAAVYAGDIRPEMFIPFNFYKYMDRDTGKKSKEDSNGMFFFDLVLRYPQTFKFYASLFVDVTSIRDLLNNKTYSTWVGTTVGGRKIDFIVDNLDLTIEYTRTTPWVYEHKYGSLTDYKHLGYSLGHWIGQNADQLKIQFDYQPVRGLKTQIYTEMVRKGGLKDISEVYDKKSELPFLYPPIRKDYYFGINAEYEVFHDLFIESKYRYSNISDEDQNRTEQFMLGEKNFFSIGFKYGRF
jgi:hypothetical protein